MISNADSGLWLCLHFRQLPLEIFTRGLTAEERQKPVVVVERHRVCYLNPAAEVIGIQPGNNMDTAYTLSEQVVSFERDPMREYAALSQLAQWAYQFTPSVSVKAPDSLLLDIGACLKLFKGLHPLKRRISKGLANLGYAATMGVNRTPLAALCTAKSRSPDNRDDVAASLRHVPIVYLQVDEKIVEALHQMGIEDTGSLLELPASGLSRRFGVYFADYLARLTGEKPDPQKFISPDPKFSSEITFLADVTNIEALLFPIKRLLGELDNFLKVRQLSIDRFTWKLSHRSHPSKSFSIYLADPENDRTIFLPLTQLKLDQVDDVEEVDGISLTASRFFPADSQSGDLFHGTLFQQKDGRVNSSGNRARADNLLNMLHARLGPGTCFGLSVANDHRPERAWKLVRLGEKTEWRAGSEVEENPRPVFLLGTPRVLNVIDRHPCLGGRLELLKGPERIDFGWWDEPSISRPIARDYYIARQKSGSLFWIFRHQGMAGDARWYLHGIFS